MNRRLWELEQECQRGEFYVSTYSPGDGVTRYRFSSESGDYFEMRKEFTALGFKEAMAYAKGRVDGVNQTRGTL